MTSAPQPAAAELPQPVDPDLRACEQLLALHLDAVTRRFGAVALGVIDLPSLGSESLIPAQIRVAAVLAWCLELERAGLLPFVEALAQAVERGEDGLVLGAAARLLRPFGRRGTERPTADERRATYAQLFDSERSGFDFDASMRGLLRSLDAIGRARPHDSLAHLQIQAATRAIELGRELSTRAVGMVAFVARDVVADIRAALALLREPELTVALGGGPVASIVERHAPRLLGRPVRYSHFQDRARQSMTVLRWIADGAGDLQVAARELGRSHEVVFAAQMLMGDAASVETVGPSPWKEIPR